ncbi:RBBP9/YdeN family alpha/beta hydrolase [Arcicella aurantiaca]|nr:alpha/beta hydrolase [Arcicella aurantiaca]
MNRIEQADFLVVPGLGSSGINHWQTLWEKQYSNNFKRVEQNNWDLPVCDVWIKKLSEEVNKLTKPTYLVAHSLGCLTVVHWANNYFSEKIKGAFLVAPADAESSRRLSFLDGFSPIPKEKLPFESIVIASTTDQYATIDRSAEFANAWGSQFINIGKKGHINANSNIGIWEEGQNYLSNFITI